MGLKEKAEKLKKKRSVKGIPHVADDTSTKTIDTVQDADENSSTSSFGTIAALIVGAIGIILLKGRKS